MSARTSEVADRRTVTVLFADIVGSTDAAAGLDVERMRADLALVFDRARDVIQAYGGTVEKFIGDAVMAVFGLPQGHDDDAERAVRAAIALHKLAEQLSGSVEFPLRFRVGINTGEVASGDVARGDFFVTGLPVIVGARLYPMAEPGGTLVGPLTKKLTDQAVKYADAVQVDGKGTGRFDAWRVDGLLAAEPGTLPSAGPRLEATMLGRDNDLALLGELLSRTRQDRRPHLVTVLGDAGVGKSRLVREFARKTDAVVRLGRCLPYGDSIEFHAIRSVIKDEASIGPDEDTNAAANKLKAHVLALCSGANGPAVADRLVVLAGLAEAGVLLAGVSSEDLMTELGWAFQTFIARVASTRPLLLIFEDVHWATPRILDLIEGLTHGPEGMMLLCCIARPELVESRPTWGTQSPHASTVRLRPLDMTAAQRLVLELLQVEDLPRSLVADIADRSGGNPLYVEEILRALIASGHLRRSAGGWEAASSTTPTDVPDTLRGVITARLDRLSPSTKLLLQHGSALGRFFPLRGVRALGAEEPTSAHAVQEAIRSDFLVVTDEAPSPEGPRYHFRHALIRDAVYGSIPKQHRRRLHERAADWLEREVERGDDVAERVAYHLEQAFTLAAESRDADVASIGRRAYAALTALATRERQMHTFLDSTPFYERAERIASGIGIPVAERKDDIAWYACARHGPKHADADQSDLFDTLALVRDLGPTTGLAQLLGFASRHAGPAALAMAAESLTVARATGDPAAIGWALWYMRHASDPADRETDRRLLEETLSIAQEHDLKDLLPFALMAVAERAIQEGDLGRARQIHEEAYAGALASGAKRVLAHAAIRLALDHARVRELARMTTLIDEAIAAARQTANPEVIAAVLRQAAPAELENGMQERGNAHAEELAALGQVTR